MVKKGADVNPGSTRGEDTLDSGRRLARRRMAWISFTVLVASAALIMYGLVVSPFKESVATSLSVASGVVTGLMTVFTTIVVGYLGVSVCERLFKKDEG